jgi:hypothetical protein
MVPVGIYEENDHLVINIGQQIERGAFTGLDDKTAADHLMLRIAALVPEATRGIYAERYQEHLELEHEAWRTQLSVTDHVQLGA